MHCRRPAGAEDGEGEQVLLDENVLYTELVGRKKGGSKKKSRSGSSKHGSTSSAVDSAGLAGGTAAADAAHRVVGGGRVSSDNMLGVGTSSSGLAADSGGLMLDGESGGGADGASKRSVDGVKKAVGRAYFNVIRVAVSPNGNYLAYSVDLTGMDRAHIFIRDLRSHSEVLPRITNLTDGSFEWNRDSTRILYVGIDQRFRSCYLYCHDLVPRRSASRFSGSESGSGSSETDSEGGGSEDEQKGAANGGQPLCEDRLLWHETDTAFAMSLGYSHSHEYLFAEVNSQVTSEVRFISTAVRDDEDVQILLKREELVKYSVQHHGAMFYVMSNEGGAINYKIVAMPIADRSSDQWIEVSALVRRLGG